MTQGVSVGGLNVNDRVYILRVIKEYTIEYSMRQDIYATFDACEITQADNQHQDNNP